MKLSIARRLAELGITLPEPGKPGGNYLSHVITGDLVFLAGQVPRTAGRIVCAGKVGGTVSVEQAQAAARLCALNLLAELQVACDGNLDRVVQCVRVGGFVSCVPEFREHPKVINGASDLIVEIFGERGRHARTSVGVAALPGDSAVEVEAVFQIAGA